MGLFTDLRDRGLWEGYSRYVVAMESLLAAASRRGLPVSAERHAEVSGELRTRRDALFVDMQAAVPDEVKQLKVYKRKPPVRLPFRPSKKALVRYMNFRNHRVPRHWKSQKETTAEDELRRLYRETNDPLYGYVLGYRDAQTMLSNHLHNWRPGADGRVHPTFYNTATGQLEARRPNTMNAPRHKPTQGNLFRSIVQARPGHTLLSFDYRGFHALYLAWESGDKDFERVVRLDVHSYLTAHFLRLPDCEQCLGWPDDDLRDYLARVKREYGAIRDAKVKHALLGYNNGMGWRKLFFQYRDFFDKQAEAKRLLELLDALFPRAAAFRRRIVEQAHEQGYLVSKFGCLRYFWEVKQWRGAPARAVAKDGLVTCGVEVHWKKCEWRGTKEDFKAHWEQKHAWCHGDDAEAAISFVQQNHAHCHLKGVMLKLDVGGWLERAGFATPIHDDLTFECPDALVEEAVPYIRAAMEAPNPTTGLSVGVDVKAGRTWNNMSLVSNDSHQ